METSIRETSGTAGLSGAGHPAAALIHLLMRVAARRLRCMSTNPGYGIESNLCPLLSTTLLLTREVAGAESAWTTPLVASRAGRELSAQEARADRPTGSWPWLASLKIARWGLQVAIEVTGSFSVLLRHGGTSYAADGLCRMILEHTSLTFCVGPGHRRR